MMYKKNALEAKFLKISVFYRCRITYEQNRKVRENITLYEKMYVAKDEKV